MAVCVTRLHIPRAMQPFYTVACFAFAVFNSGHQLSTNWYTIFSASEDSLLGGLCPSQELIHDPLTRDD